MSESVMKGNWLLEKAMTELFDDEELTCPRCHRHEVEVDDLGDLLVCTCQVCGWKWIEDEEEVEQLLTPVYIFEDLMGWKPVGEIYGMLSQM